MLLKIKFLSGYTKNICTKRNQRGSGFLRHIPQTKTALNDAGVVGVFDADSALAPIFNAGAQDNTFGEMLHDFLDDPANAAALPPGLLAGATAADTLINVQNWLQTTNGALTNLFAMAGFEATMDAWAGGAVDAASDWFNDNTVATTSGFGPPQSVTRDLTAAEILILEGGGTITGANLVPSIPGSVHVDGTNILVNFNPATEADPGGYSLWFHIGANEGQGVRLNIRDVSVRALGLEHLRNFNSNVDPAGNIIGDTGYDGVMIQSGENLGNMGLLRDLDESLAMVTGQRSLLGAMQNRLEFSIENLDIASENLSAANSRIRDADMALEMMRLTQANVLQQAATAMLAQANQAPQSILQLLG